ADVIKIESPDGDLYRKNGVSRNRNMTAQWMACNRNKRSVALDLKTDEGLDVLRKLLAGANAFLHNMRPPAIKRLGLDYDSVKEMNETIVYCFSGGFGQDGPYRDFPAFDDIIQAYCGLASLNGIQTGQPEFVPMVVCDTITGLNLGQALLAGLLRQQMQGKGTCIEVPMYEVMVSAVMNQHLSGHAFEPPEGPLGYARVMNPSRRPSPTKDGYLVHGIYKLENWRRFFGAIGRDDLLNSPMLSDAQSVAANIGELYRIVLEDILPTRNSNEWIALFDELDIPYGQVNNLTDLLDDEHLRQVGLFESFEHPTEGPMRQVRQPIAVTGAERHGDVAPPMIGQHSSEVLAEFGFDESAIKELRSANIIGGAQL
ncbi:MAG: CoA transferase, partial [Chromatiales bacterium]|nr:CoA transferase [Chromatiales bacterium]